VARDLKTTLTKLGYDVVGTASSGEDAIRLTKNFRPDIILMDIMLTKGFIDGVETVEILRNQFDVPIVYLTAYSDEQTLHRAKMTEPFGYLLKPFHTRDLQITIEMAVYRHKIETRMREVQVALNTIKSIGDAVIATDKEGIIMFMNPVAEYLTGWTGTDAASKDVREVFKIQSGKKKVCRWISNHSIVDLE